jgi:glycine hydroxymethyltransferase
MDTFIRRILENERNRQADTVELIASENFASMDVMKLCGSEFTNKYAEGYPSKRYYNGCENMDEIETYAIELLCELYGSEFANVQPHSGANANTAVYQAFLNPGDKILGMDLASGGHLSHGASVNLSGKVYEAHSYGVDEDGWLDYVEIYDIAQQIKPKMIIAGASAYPRQIKWKTFRQIANDCGAMLVADMAHYSGLIAGGVYDSPVGIADVVTSTTHKTLRGPRGGFILWDDEKYSKRINSAIFPGTQGGPLMNMVAAKAQAFSEASQPHFKKYAQNVVNNAMAMAHQFNRCGMKMVTDGTDSHIILLDLSNSKYSGAEAADLLEENGITVNKNGIPNDPRSFIETSGIRIGTAAETTRGWNENDFAELADVIADILS